MIYLHKHRLIDEIEKKREKGQILHFLTGNHIDDNFFYDMHEGVLSLADNLVEYYLRETREFEYFVYVASTNTKMICRQRTQEGVEEIPFDALFSPPEVDSPLSLDGGRQASEDDTERQGADAARAIGDSIAARINLLDELLKEHRLLIFLENLEWISSLYEPQADLIWIATMRRWAKSRNLLMIATIKDMELLEKYNFEQEETFLSGPSADEIKYAYLRHILRHTDQNYQWNMISLDDIAHSMSVGKKSLCSCFRILRKVLREHPDGLRVDDFSAGVEKSIEEKVTWEKVRLNSKIKRDIKTAVDIFLRDDPGHKARAGLIFSGPPGTGKTMIMKALANEAKCTFMAPTLADMKGQYIGTSSANIKRIFAEARSNAPAILFIDEADTVFPSRSLGSNDRDSYTLDMVNQFLQEVDGAASGHQKIFLVAATNRPEALDSAIKSRLSHPPIYIGLPDDEQRRLIFDDNLSSKDAPFTLRGKRFEDDVLTRSEGMSGRDIMNFVKKLKEAAHSRGIQLRDDEATEELFREIFRDKEKGFIDEVVGLGIFSRENIVEPERNRWKLDNVIGYDSLKEKIRQQASYIAASPKDKKAYDDFNIKPQKGILLYGPPGNGKSVLAQAVAGEYNFYFFKILSRDFANTIPEVQIKNLEKIFSKVTQFSKMMADCPGVVLFFDEFDALVGEDILNPVVRGSLLNYIADENGLRNRDSKILFIAATNFFEKLDDAIRRQGRIDAHLYMDNPSIENGRRMLEKFFKDDRHFQPVENDVIVQAYTGLHNQKVRRQLEKRISLYLAKRVFDEHSTSKENFESLCSEWEKQLHQTVRPSGAELENLYHELKRIAFMEKPSDASKLIVTAKIVERRFRERDELYGQ